MLKSPCCKRIEEDGLSIEEQRANLYLAIDIAYVRQTDANGWMLLAVVMFKSLQGVFQMFQRLIILTFFLQDHAEVVSDLCYRGMIFSEERLGLFKRFEIEFFRFVIIAFLSMDICAR